MHIMVNCPYVFAKAPEGPGYVLRNIEEVTFQPGTFQRVNTGCLLAVQPGERPQGTFITEKPPNPKGVIMFDQVRAELEIDCQVRLISSLADLGFVANVTNVLETQADPIQITVFYLGTEPYVLPGFSPLATLHFGTLVPCEVVNEAAFPTDPVA